VTINIFSISKYVVLYDRKKYLDRERLREREVKKYNDKMAPVHESSWLTGQFVWSYIKSRELVIFSLKSTHLSLSLSLSLFTENTICEIFWTLFFPFSIYLSIYLYPLPLSTECIRDLDMNLAMECLVLGFRQFQSLTRLSKKLILVFKVITLIMVHSTFLKHTVSIYISLTLFSLSLDDVFLWRKFFVDEKNFSFFVLGDLFIFLSIRL